MEAKGWRLYDLEETMAVGTMTTTRWRLDDYAAAASGRTSGWWQNRKQEGDSDALRQKRDIRRTMTMTMTHDVRTMTSGCNCRTGIMMTTRDVRTMTPGARCQNGNDDDHMTVTTGLWRRRGTPCHIEEILDATSSVQDTVLDTSEALGADISLQDTVLDTSEALGADISV